MNKLLKQALFVVPIVVIVTAPVVLSYLKTIGVAPHIESDNNNNTPQTPSSAEASSAFAEVQKSYSMPEPFASNDIFGMTYPMQKSMEVNTWMKMLTHMMSPHGTSPEGMCALCHQEKDVVRYQRQFDLVMQPIWNQYTTMMAPHAASSFTNPVIMTQMMHRMLTWPMQMAGRMPDIGPGMMSPEQYEKWYNEQQTNQDGKQ